MSGDVQPKKRRDKRKKKEDHQEEVIHQPTPSVTPTLIVDDTNIHVHKEKSIGGGICAKCVFFIITLAIAVILGLTIVEHRGLTDIDIPLSESRFASIFEGWIDNERSDHDDHTEEISLEHEDESHEDEEEEDEGIGSEEDKEESEEESEQDQEDSEQEQEGSEQELEEESEEDREESEQDQEESEQEESEQEPEEEEEETESPEIQAESDEEDQREESDEDQQVEESEEQLQDESEEESPEPESSQEQLPEESEEEDEQKDQSEEEPQQSEEDDKEPLKRAAKRIRNQDEDQEDSEDMPNAANNGVAAKIFVGVALLVVAYVVLIKKWKSERVEKPAKKDEKDETPNLSRRNTIVPPPTLEEIEQDIENQDEYSEEEEDEESEGEPHIPATKKQYEELRATYTRSLTPDDREREEYEYDEEEEIEDEEEEGEEYEDREEDEEEDEDDDEELMKKLEEKYGRLDPKDKYGEEEQEEEVEEEEEEEDDEDGSWKRIKLSDEPESESDDEKQPKKRSGAQVYEFQNITNTEDFLIKETLDYAQQHLPNNPALALNLFIKILENFPESPRALYGRALTLDHLAEKKRSNEILQESIKYFAKVLNAKNVPDALFLAAATRCIQRMRFIGSYAKAVEIHQKVTTRFPDEIKYRNDFAVTLLTINRIPQARNLLLETLRKWPNDGFALVHFGFILKTVDDNLTLAIEYLAKGINTKEPGVIDGRFYFHLGDALARIGKAEEALKIYEDGVDQKVFLSKYQRSLYNVDRLTGRPWWKLEETPYLKLYEQLQQNWKEIRKEGLSVLDKKGYFKDESENLKDVGDWKQFELFARGVKNKENCLKCPITCQIIETSSEARSCRRGQVKFSVMHPGTHVWPHCGPTNCRLRVHLGLKVPPKTYIRVAEETRSWEEGKIMIFDDSFEHEVWHNGTEYRLVLIVDVWHPELTKSERINLSPI